MAPAPAWLDAWALWAVTGRKRGQRPAAAPARIPAKYLWVPDWIVWWRAGRPEGKRPAAAPQQIPRYAWDALEHVAAALASPQPSPKPVEATSFGSAHAAGVFAGRGIMLGSNPDVWAQARQLAQQGFCDVAAVIPGTVFDFSPARVVVWHPPQFHGSAPCVQAESQAEWDKVKNLTWDAIAINSRSYGRLDGKVALVEAYYNDGQAADFNYFQGYSDLGASAVLPLGGGYSSAVSDAEAGAIYMDLAEWATGKMPGYWMYAGESMLTAESIAALKAWRP